MDEIQLPRWQSHKIVYADKIVEVDVVKIGEGFHYRWYFASGFRVHVDDALKVRGGNNPVGGYYVRYEDGYESWSPAKAFEEGYTRL